MNRSNNNLLQEMRNLDERNKSKEVLNRGELKMSSYRNLISCTFDFLPRTSDVCSPNHKPYNQRAHEGSLSCNVPLLLLLWPNRSSVPTPNKWGKAHSLNLARTWSYYRWTFPKSSSKYGIPNDENMFYNAFW